MTMTLTDRYVHAATRWLPGRTKDEVAAELRERIADTIAAHGGTPDAEREALEELGDPLRVAVAYTGREPALIGPRHFFQWLRLTTLLVGIVVPIVTAITVIVGAFEGDSFGSIIGAGVSTLIEMTINVTFWTTLVFVILDWTGTKDAEVELWSVDRLPEAHTGTSMSDLVAGLIFLPVAAALVIWQHFGSPFSEDGERIPMADPDLWSWYLPLVLLVLALEVIHLVWVHRVGWTWTTATANLALSLAFAIPTIVLLLDNSLVNPDLVAHLNWDPEITKKVMNGVAVSIAAVSVWESFDGFRKAYSSR